MLEKRWLLIVMSIATIAMVAGCSDDDGGVGLPGGLTSEQQFQAVHDASITYINSAAPAPITAATLLPDLDNYTVLDVRSSAAFGAGHISGAINTSLATLVADLNAGTIPTDKDFVVACASGQSAGPVTLALRVLGYDAYLLKWGMAGWNSTLAAPWTNSTADGLPAPNIETAVNDLTTEVPWPTLNTGATTAEEAVDARVVAMLAEGFKTKTVAELLADGLDQYFILNYFAMADYIGQGAEGIPGHIEGAYQFTPKASLAMDQQLKYLPTDKPIVVYCWTGQTASQVASYLNMLGYDAYSLKFSSNALWYSVMSPTGHKWVEATQSQDYTLVTN